MSQEALRVLGIAYRPLDALPGNPDAEALEQELTFVGLMGMIDPARPEVEVSSKSGQRSRTKDHAWSRVTIPRQPSPLQRNWNSCREEEVLTGAELDRVDDATFATMVEKIRMSTPGLARAQGADRGGAQEPRSRGGDDRRRGQRRPCLKRADIGVAMGITGTDVSKETADMVLTDDNYASIVSAIEAGRIIYSNIRKFVFYLLSCNVARNPGDILSAMSAGLPVPLRPIQLLLLNLVLTARRRWHWGWRRKPGHYAPSSRPPPSRSSIEKCNGESPFRAWRSP